MKKLEIKKKLAVLISGLAFFMLSGLQCTAQTNQNPHKGAWKILIIEKEQEKEKGGRKYDYKENGNIFIGSWQNCNKIKRDLENEQYRKESTELSQAKENNDPQNIRLGITEAKVKAVHKIFELVFMGYFCSECVSEEYLDSLAKIWDDNFPKYTLTSLVEEYYPKFRAQHPDCIDDEDAFKKRVEKHIFEWLEKRKEQLK